MDSEPKKESFELSLGAPAAILIAGVIIAGAIIYIGSGNKSDLLVGNVESGNQSEIDLKPISSTDHVRGSFGASVIIVEFSDLECPFCKTFHATMQKIISEYGNEVAWVYRHFPLDIHSRARDEAEATECAALLGGNSGFWKYIDGVFEITPSNNNLEPDLLLTVAEEIGLDRKAFEECLTSDKYANYIEQSITDAVNAGARGTPHSILITKSGEMIPISGALPYSEVKEMVKSAL